MTPGIHGVINERIDYCVAHRQPVEREVYVLGVFIEDNLVVNELVNEVAMKW